MTFHACKKKVEEISNTVHESVDPDANIIFGTSYDEKLTGKVKVSLIVTGMTKVHCFAQ